MHAINKPKLPRKTPDTINVVISVTNDTLPYWCEDIRDGEWGEDVTISVYIKTPGLRPDEERVLASNDRFEMIAIPNFGRNEHSYVWHLARKASSFAGVEIFTKTNAMNCDAQSRNRHGRCDLGRMVKYMVDVARNGSYESVSYPWDLDRRYLVVRCDPVWNDHPLYHDLCEVAQPGKKPSYLMQIRTRNYKYGRVPLFIINDPKVTTSSGPADLRFALSQVPQPLPLIHETYGEGMFAVRRDVLNQYSASWYHEWKSITYAQFQTARDDAEAAMFSTAYDGLHHDVVMMEIFPLLFGQATDKQEVHYWVDDGCRTERDSIPRDYAGAYVQEAQAEAFARCCADDGSSCTSPQNCIAEQPGTHFAAAAACHDQGMRLCTSHELLSEVCCGTGGSCDSYPIWTSSAGATTPQEKPAWLVSTSTVDLFDTVDAMMKFSEADRKLPILIDSWREGGRGYDANHSMYAKSEYLEHPVYMPLPEW
ncbi:unnamed protein product [Prorocentrum cordatum]|uniref:Uncharacterized protein n=1 Tax=Prorocentrum cordatum TaxID=2364126 RepID=A0ABN9UIK2_9DINO|nr:unnamed protein product [Polarella glacialis]